MRDGTFQKSALTLLLRYTLAFLLIGLLWEAASRAAGESLLPSPVTTALLFFQSLSDPVYIGHLVVSLKRLIYGLTAGAVPALFLGLGDASRVLLIALTTGYQMIVIVRAAALSLDPVYETAITCMGAGRWDRIRYVYLPAALPSFLTSLKVACGTAVAVLFLAESFATTTGLGFLIMDAWGVGDTLAMFNGILGMSVIGLLLYAAVWLSEVVLTPWCRAVQLH